MNRVSLCWAAARVAGSMTLASAAVCLPGAAHAAACEDMLQAKIPKVQVIAASEVVGSLPETDLAPSLVPASPALRDLPRFCRMIATLAAVPKSHVRIEIWFPERWNGKLLAIGNHGFGGEFEHIDMAQGVRRNYAVAMSDVGQGSRGIPSASNGEFSVGNAQFTGGNRVAVEDFAGRATHGMTAVAKVAIQLYYGSGPKLSYFDGCSFGGNQAYREAQQFPLDYDGIIVGSAALNWTRFQAADLWQYTTARDLGAGMTAAKLLLAKQAAVAACDHNDGLADGLIADPLSCHWRPSSVVCKPGADPNLCLTEAQAATIERMYEGMKDPRTGRLLIAGWYPGVEDLFASSYGNMLALNSVALNYFRYTVTHDPSWKPDNANVFDLLRQSEAPGALNALINITDPDLSAFKRHGGKMIQYHGWNDQTMPPAAYPALYDQVIDLQPGRDRLASTQSFYRLFMVPGMGHCRGGDGPTNFGALSDPDSPMINAEQDVLEALDRWVEDGRAPERLVATQFASADRPQRQMPLCPYPKVAVYVGGDTSRAESFACKPSRSATATRTP